MRSVKSSIPDRDCFIVFTIVFIAPLRNGNRRGDGRRFRGFNRVSFDRTFRNLLLLLRHLILLHQPRRGELRLCFRFRGFAHGVQRSRRRVIWFLKGFCVRVGDLGNTRARRFLQVLHHPGGWSGRRWYRRSGRGIRSSFVNSRHHSAD